MSITRPSKRKPRADQSKEAGTPEPPPLDPRYGDKTPAYARWLRQYHPEEFQRKFAHRIIELEEETQS